MLVVAPKVPIWLATSVCCGCWIAVHNSSRYVHCQTHWLPDPIWRRIRCVPEHVLLYLERLFDELILVRRRVLAEY